MVKVAQNSAAPRTVREAAIPVVRRAEADIEDGERVRIRDLAKRLLDAEPALNASNAFGGDVSSGLADTPRLLIGDQSEIPLMGNAEEAAFGYRIALLAGDGDTLVLAQDRNIPFETYLKDLLGISSLNVLEVGIPDPRERTSLPLRCLRSPDVFDQLVHLAREGKGLCLVPHITTGHVWRLGCAVARHSNTHVSVCGPPPRLSRRANDKLWFAARVRDVLGRGSVPPTFAAYGPSALAAHVQRLARRYERVVVKIPDSAGSAGNLPLESRSLTDLSLPRLRGRLLGLLRALGWGDGYPLLVEVWETDVVSSPSVQLWIPHPNAGLPIVEGVFEQTVEGEEGDFVGAARAHLPPVWTGRLVDEAVRLAFLLQQLGYFGRCSFDAVIVGGDHPNVHWIECNGRWGGVSLPMTLANRIIPDPATSELFIVQREALSLRPVGFADLLGQIAGRLYRPGQNEEGVIPLTPAGFEQGRGVHFMVVARSLVRARAMAVDTLAALTEV